MLHPINRLDQQCTDVGVGIIADDLPHLQSLQKVESSEGHSGHGSCAMECVGDELSE